MKIMRIIVAEDCLKKSQDFGISIVDFFAKAFTDKSKTELRNLIKNKGLTAGSFKINSIFARIKLSSEQDKVDFEIDEDFFVLVDTGV